MINTEVLLKMDWPEHQPDNRTDFYEVRIQLKEGNTIKWGNRKIMWNGTKWCGKAGKKDSPIQHWYKRVVVTPDVFIKLLNSEVI